MPNVQAHLPQWSVAELRSGAAPCSALSCLVRYVVNAKQDIIVASGAQDCVLS